MVYIEPMRESPKTLVCCPWCTDGIFRPAFGESGDEWQRCSNCGAAEEYGSVPVILGGQGNTVPEIIESGKSYGWIILAMVLCVVGGMILGSVLS